MSYGVLASKPAHVRVENVGPTAVRADPGVLHRRPRRGDHRPWGTGKLTLTSRHLTFNPTSGSSVPALTIALADVVSVEPGVGRLHKSLVVRTDAVVLHARVSGVSGFIDRISVSVDNMRRRRVAPPARPSSAERDLDRDQGQSQSQGSSSPPLSSTG